MADMFGWKNEDDEEVQHYSFEYDELFRALRKMENIEKSLRAFTERHPSYIFDSTFYVGDFTYIVEFEVIKIK
jgi:hypothetical protein